MTHPKSNERPSSAITRECVMMLETLREMTPAADLALRTYVAMGGPTPAAEWAVRHAERLLHGYDTTPHTPAWTPDVLRSLVRVVGRWATNPPLLARQR